MIDWTKPVRWTDNGDQAEVLKVNGDGTAWVAAKAGYAYLFDSNGKRNGVVNVENIPQPTVLWCNYYGEWRGHRPSVFCAYGTRDMADLNASLCRTALYRLEISEDGKTITGERVE